MKSNYEVNFLAPNEDELAKNIWLMDALKNKLKQVFMTPTLILPQNAQDDQTQKILGIFNEPGHSVKKIMVIPGGTIEILVDNLYLLHFIFLRSREHKGEGKITVSIQQLDISPIANSDTEDNPNME